MGAKQQHHQQQQNVKRNTRNFGYAKIKYLADYITQIEKFVLHLSAWLHECVYDFFSSSSFPSLNRRFNAKLFSMPLKFMQTPSFFHSFIHIRIQPFVCSIDAFVRWYIGWSLHVVHYSLRVHCLYLLCIIFAFFFSSFFINGILADIFYVQQPS